MGSYAQPMRSSRRQFLTHIGAAGLANWVFFPHPLAANRSGQLALGADTNKSAVPADTDGVAKRVRQEFLHAWNGYKQYAWATTSFVLCAKAIGTGMLCRST